MKYFINIAVLVFMASILSVIAAQEENPDSSAKKRKGRLGLEIGSRSSSLFPELKRTLSIGVSYYYSVGKSTCLGFNSNYQCFKDKSGSDKASIYIIPATYGFKYYLSSKDIQPYFGIDGGIFILVFTANLNNFPIILFGVGYGFLLKAGTRIPVNSVIDCDINFKYYIIPIDTGFMQLMYGLNAGLSFAV